MMIRYRDALGTIVYNITRAAWRGGILYWRKFRIAAFLRGLSWLLTRPYKILMRFSADGNSSLTERTNGWGGSTAMLIDLFFSPYELYRRFVGNIGETEFDKDALKFWFTVGFWTLIGTFVIAVRLAFD